MIRYATSLLVILSLLTGCGNWAVDDVMETFIETDELVTSFYGEGISSQYLDDELLFEYNFKEWKGEGQDYRIEFKAYISDKYKKELNSELAKGDYEATEEIDVYHDNQIIAYVPDTDIYHIKPISLADEVDPAILDGINRVIYYGGPKEYALKTISDISKTHEVFIEDNKNLNGYTTQHLIAKPKAGNEAKGYVELWIDQDSWMIVKEKYVIGNLTNISEYQYFEINKKVDPNKFIMEIPQDAKVVRLSENLEKVKKEVSLEEAVQLLQVPVMHLEENNFTKLKSANYIEVSNELYAKIELIYLVEGKEVLVESRPASSLQESLDFGYEKVRINDVEGIYVEKGAMKIIEFVKGKTLCDIYVKNSSLTKEELIYWAKKLKVFE